MIGGGPDRAVGQISDKESPSFTSSRVGWMSEVNDGGALTDISYSVNVEPSVLLASHLYMPLISLFACRKTRVLSSKIVKSEEYVPE